MEALPAIGAGSATAQCHFANGVRTYREGGARPASPAGDIAGYIPRALGLHGYVPMKGT